jgi:hypothetical protein
MVQDLSFPIKPEKARLMSGEEWSEIVARCDAMRCVPKTKDTKDMLGM